MDAQQKAGYEDRIEQKAPGLAAKAGTKAAGSTKVDSPKIQLQSPASDCITN